MTTEKGGNDPCSPRQLGLPARHNIETIFKNNIAKSESTEKMMFLGGKAKGFSSFFGSKKLQEKKSLTRQRKQLFLSFTKKTGCGGGFACAL